MFSLDRERKKKYPAWALLAVHTVLQKKEGKTPDEYHTSNLLYSYERRCKEAAAQDEEGDGGNCIFVTATERAHAEIKRYFNLIHDTKICLPKKYLG